MIAALSVLCVGLALIGIGVSLHGLLGTLLIVVGCAVSLSSVWAWRRYRDPKPEPRIGYVGRPGSKGDLSRAEFGENLDRGIDNAGEVDASEADFQ